MAFVDLAGEGDAVVDGFVDLPLTVCDRTVTDPARFSQTSVGWLLRALSAAAPDRVRAFVDAHADNCRPRPDAAPWRASDPTAHGVLSRVAHASTLGAAEGATMDLAQFRAAQRRMWEDGDYRPVGRLLEPAARILVDHAGVATGQRVLDVATGSGNVALAAAAEGAHVVGVDITDTWFDEARRRARAAGVDVDLRIGDAENLPFDDASFDVVLSNFGAIFAPRHDVMAAELARVCRPGGTVGLTAWTPEGTSNTLMSTLTSDLPPPPSFVTPPIRWGDRDHARRTLGAHGLDVTFAQPSFVIEFASIDEFESFVFDNSGGIMAARRALEEAGRWEHVRATFRSTAQRQNEADDGGWRSTWDFLLVRATKRR